MARPWLDRENARRVAPFAAAAMVGLALATLHPEPPLLNVVLAVAILAGVATCSVVGRWARPPAPGAVVPPLGFLLVVGLLRADNGVGTGFGYLSMLSVFWIALYGRRWQLAVVLAGVGVLFALPLTGAVGHGYTAGDLRAAVVSVSVSALIGFTAQALVSREREQRRSLSRQHAFLDAMFTAAGSLVAVVELDGRVSRANPACERLGGFAEAEIVGRPFWDMLMPPHSAVAMERWWEEREPAARAGVAETPMLDRSGGRHVIHWTLEALADEDGEVVNFVATGLDVTAERATQRELQEERDRFNTVLRATTEHMIVGTEPDGTITFVNPGVEKLLGYRAEELIGLRPRLFHEPVEGAAGAVERDRPIGLDVLTAGARSGRPEQHDWSCFDAEGRRLTVSLTITAVPGPDGEPAGFIGIADDVSARRRAEAEVAASEYRLRAVLSNLPGAIVSLYDRDLRCQMIDGGSLAERSIDASQFLGHTLEEAVPAENAAAVRPALEAALAGEHSSIEYQSHRDETVYELEVLPYERHGEIEGALIVSRDITERKSFEEEMQKLAEFDSLSGLLNRRAFERELLRHLNEVARYECAGALLLIDVDRFKTVNDTLGHARGDELIVAIAGILEDHLRGPDLAGRLGGDEFAVLLPRADRAEAETVAERLVAAVRGRQPVAAGELPRPVTISVGATNFSKGSHRHPERPLIEADLAMYEAKAAGGDGFSFRDGSPAMFLA